MKPSKWQPPRMRFSGLEKECRTMYDCNSNMVLSILQRKGNTNSRILIKSYCLLTMFFRPLPKLECGKKKRNHLIFLGYPHSSLFLSPFSIPPSSMKISLLPRVHFSIISIDPSWTSCQDIWLGTVLSKSPLLLNLTTEESPLVILCPFLPLPVLPAACSWCDPLKT